MARLEPNEGDRLIEEAIRWMQGNVVVREEESLSMLLVSIITDHQVTWARKTFLEIGLR